MIDDTGTTHPSQSERLLSAFSHVSILLSNIGFIVPVIIWVIQANQKNKSEYLAFQSLQALIYQISIIIIGFTGYVISIFSVHIASTYLIFPMMITLSIAKFIFIIYGIIGAIITIQGKSFSYWIIGNQIKLLMPTINLKPSIIYITLIVFIIMYVLIIVAYGFLIMMGQTNA